MAKEVSDKEAWENWKKSGNPDLEKLADEMFPVLSVNDEILSAKMDSDMGRIIYVAKILRKYRGPKGNFLNNEEALTALGEIRTYSQ